MSSTTSKTSGRLAKPERHAQSGLKLVRHGNTVIPKDSISCWRPYHWTGDSLSAQRCRKITSQRCRAMHSSSQSMKRCPVCSKNINDVGQKLLLPRFGLFQEFGWLTARRVRHIRSPSWRLESADNKRRYALVTATVVMGKKAYAWPLRSVPPTRSVLGAVHAGRDRIPDAGMSAGRREHA
jgi:hypothetical protein